MVSKCRVLWKEVIAYFLVGFDFFFFCVFNIKSTDYEHSTLLEHLKCENKSYFL